MSPPPLLPDPQVPLTPDEFRSLREVSKGLMQHEIPLSHRARLLEVGYIKKGVGGWTLTDAGRARVLSGH